MQEVQNTKQKTVSLFSAPAITQMGGPGNYSLSGPAMTVDAVKLDSAAKNVIMDMDFNWGAEDTQLGDGWADEISGPAKFGKPVPSASSPMWFASTLASEPITRNVDVHPLDGRRDRGRPAADQPIPGDVKDVSHETYAQTCGCFRRTPSGQAS